MHSFVRACVYLLRRQKALLASSAAPPVLPAGARSAPKHHLGGAPSGRRGRGTHRHDRRTAAAPYSCGMPSMVAAQPMSSASGGYLATVVPGDLGGDAPHSVAVPDAV